MPQHDAVTSVQTLASCSDAHPTPPISWTHDAVCHDIHSWFDLHLTSLFSFFSLSHFPSIRPPRQTEPSSIDPSTTFNVIGIQFTDAECTDPTGVEEVVADEDFENCYTLVEEGPHLLSKCLGDGLLLTQQFSAHDSTCTGEVNINTPASQNVMYHAVLRLLSNMNPW